MTAPDEFQRTAQGDQAALEINHRHALWSAERFRLLYPQYSATLHFHDWHYELVVEGVDAVEFVALSKHFDNAIRPLSCAISLALVASAGVSPVADTISYRDELWMSHEPLRLVDAQRALVIARANLPRGELDYSPQRGEWTFVADEALDDEAQRRVREAFEVINQPGTLRLQVLAAEKTDSAHQSTVAGVIAPSRVERVSSAFALDIHTSAELGRYPLTFRRLAERDEDDWRVFLHQRAERFVPHTAPQPAELACLFDAQDGSSVSLSELLTLYDRIDILPPPRFQGGGGVLERFALSERELQELVRLRRVRLVLPYSIDHYEDRLVESVFSAHPDAIVMTRGLAAMSIAHGQAKDPLLYGPFDRSQRQQVLHALSRMRGQDVLGKLVDSYGKIIAGQHQLFMDRGAIASLGAGLGAHVANVMAVASHSNLNIMLAGAHVEWSLALGATYIPVTLHQAALDKEAALVASFYGRVSRVPDTPFADRMHEVASGLLAISDVPPLDIARNLSLPALHRFREVARKMLRHAATAEEIQASVAQLNTEVSRYESRLDRLRHWGLNELTARTIEHGAAAYVHHGAGLAGSVLGLWLVEKLYEQLPHVAREEFENMFDAIRGLVLSPSYDAVVVRQVRNVLSRSAE